MTGSTTVGGGNPSRLSRDFMSPQERSVAEQLSQLGVDDDDDWQNIPRFGSPCLTMEETRENFASAPSQSCHFFVAFPWTDVFQNRRVTYKIVLSSFPPASYSFSISGCGLYLLIKTRIPNMMLDVFSMNKSMFKNAENYPEAQYAADHVRTIAEQEAIQSLCASEAGGLKKDNEGRYHLLDIKRLPFKVSPEFCELEGRKGVVLRLFQNGLKVAIIELIAASASSRNQSANVVHSFDECSYAGNRSFIPMNYTTGGASCVSVNLRTGTPRFFSCASRVSVAHQEHPNGIPNEIGLQSMQGIEEEEESTAASVPMAKPLRNSAKKQAQSSKNKKISKATADSQSCPHQFAQAAMNLKDDNAYDEEGNVSL